MISRRVKVLVSTRNHPSMSVTGTKRISRDVRSLVLSGRKRIWRSRAPTSEFDPTRTSNLTNPEAGRVPFHTRRPVAKC
jgi:hypothetical protein